MGWNVVGQEHVLQGLRRALTQGRVAHAYLLVGPPQVGKGTLALDLAQALNCIGDEPPCGQCLQCRRIREGKHADVEILTLETAPEDGHQPVEIGIGLVREVQRRTALPPYEGRHRVFIIDGAELLSQEAANALLKSLEEPVPGVVFLLLTMAEEALLPTVRSRCQRLELRPLALDTVAQVLREQYDQEPARAEELARFSQGCLGRAVQAVRDPEVLTQWQEGVDLLLRLSQAPLEERFASAASLATQFTADRGRIRQTLTWWEEWWRDVLLISYGVEEYLRHQERDQALRDFAQRLSPEKVLHRLESLQATRFALEHNANPRLALEVLMLDLAF